jgi:hypothetical protein
MKSLGIFLFLIALTTLVDAQKKRTVFDDVDFIVEPVSIINTVASDISPLFVDDSIYFSGISEKYFNKKGREKRNMDFYNIYSASIDQNGIISSPRLLVPGFGNDFHEGPADYCEATGELFVTVSNVEDFDVVQKMIPVENIRLRLVIKKKIDGSWQTTKELPFNGNKFNFAQPAISVTGDTLVFSSDMKPNYGSTDLFMSIRENGEWSSPVNLGSEINTVGNELFPTFILGDILSFSSNGQTTKNSGLDIYYTQFPKPDKVEILSNQINSPFDDFGLIIHKNSNVGYFTSNRSGESSDDIYRIDINRQNKIINGKIIDDITNVPIADAEVILSNCNGSIINKVLSDSIGNFSFEIKKNKCQQIKVIKEKYENEVITISDRDYLEFRLKLKQTFEIFIIDATNRSPIEDAIVSCNDEINLNTNKEGIVAFTPPFPSGCELLIKKEGYLLQILTPNFIFSNSVKTDTVLFHKIALNKSYVLCHIDSVSGELKILQETKPAFDKLIKIMKFHPDLIIELGWHTDSRDYDNVNIRLSQNRADVAVSYIVNKGIDKNRIVGKGYGESKLVNKCKNGVKCTEKEHRMNRRIEYKIIGFQ